MINVHANVKTVMNNVQAKNVELVVNAHAVKSNLVVINASVQKVYKYYFNRLFFCNNFYVIMVLDSLRTFYNSKYYSQ